MAQRAFGREIQTGVPGFPSDSPRVYGEEGDNAGKVIQCLAACPFPPPKELSLALSCVLLKTQAFARLG